MTVRNLNNNLDTKKILNEVLPLCPDGISKIFSSDAALAHPYNLAELTSPYKLHVHLRAYVDFYGGYAQHGREILFGLNNSGSCLVKLEPITSFVDIDPFLHNKCSFYTRTPGFKQKDSIFMVIAGPGWCQEKFIPKDRYSIAWTMIESICCHPDMKEWLDVVKEVWAPTSIDELRFKSLGCKNIKVMNLGYDPNLYNTEVKPVEFPDLTGRYVFGVLGSWNKRKGIKKILKAFCRAFSSKDNVSLLLVSKYGTRPYDGDKDGESVLITDKEKWNIKYELDNYIKEFRDAPHITLIDTPIHETVLPHVVANFNSLVGFSMGESTWLPGLELMAMGKPIIQLASQCSGFSDYLNEGNSYLCKKVNYAEADEELWKGTSDYYKNQTFADGDEFELAETMLKVYKERNSDNQHHKIQRGLETVKGWTWKHSVDKVVNRLKEIRGICG